MKYGLKKEQWRIVEKILASHPEVEQAVLFGSRAMGNFRETSDVDIAIKGGRANTSLAAQIRFEIEENTWLPFFFDIIAYGDLQNPELKKHIDEFGKVVYDKGECEKCLSLQP